MTQVALRCVQNDVGPEREALADADVAAIRARCAEEVERGIPALVEAAPAVSPRRWRLGQELYAGPLGQAFGFLHLYERSGAREQLELASRYLDVALVALAQSGVPRPEEWLSFHASGGTAAVAAVVCDRLGDTVGCERHVESYRRLARSAADANFPSEDLLWGRGGFSFGAALLRSHLGESSLPDELIMAPLEQMIATGRRHARTHAPELTPGGHGIPPLLYMNFNAFMVECFARSLIGSHSRPARALAVVAARLVNWEFERRDGLSHRYDIGLVQGFSGDLYLMLHFPQLSERLDADEEVRASLDCLAECVAAEHGILDLLPSRHSDPGVFNDKIHWCNGTTCGRTGVAPRTTAQGQRPLPRGSGQRLCLPVPLPRHIGEAAARSSSSLRALLVERSHHASAARRCASWISLRGPHGHVLLLSRLPRPTSRSVPRVRGLGVKTPARKATGPRSRVITSRPDPSRRSTVMATAVSASRPLDVVRLTGSLGAEVRGLDLTKAGPEDAEAILALIAEHLVLFFPDQHLTPDEHIAFGRLFGRLEGHPNLALDAERPEFFELRAEGGAGAIADEWHSDLTCQAKPSIYAILHMKKCPPFGGDTLWANMYKAYDELSPPLKDLCEGLSALHDASPHYTPERKAIHPVVRVHPVTGRKSLFVNEHFTRRIVELSHKESEVLLGFLTGHVVSNRFTVRYHWSEGTIAMWDNRCTQHHVLNDFEGERVIQRVTVMGDEPEAAAEPRYQPFGSRFRASSWRDKPLKDFLLQD